ncbi:hypothetical protein BTVI_135314 [Pitangus sulphuratus]|nr:hypothetical protein BTVI_135314 [Pitangus sulphuratus]
MVESFTKGVFPALLYKNHSRFDAVSLGVPSIYRDVRLIRPNQHRCTEGRSCLTNLTSFYDKVTCLVDEGKAVDVVYLDFSKVFDAVSHTILKQKLAAHGMDRYALLWVKNWLAGSESGGKWS